MKIFKLIVSKFAQYALLGGFILSPMAFAGQQAGDYKTATRYDIAGRVTGVISPDADGSGPVNYYLAARNTYNATTGQLEKVESGRLTSWPDENVKPANWSSYGFQVQRTTVYTYDSDGRKRTEGVKDENGQFVSFTDFGYDGEGRLQCMAARMNPQLFGSASAPCSLTTEGEYGPDRITRYTYDSRDQVLTETRAYGTSLSQQYVTNTYDGYLLTSQKDAGGNVTELRYDDYGRLQRRVYPSKTVKGQVNEADYNEYFYDANGNMRSDRKRNGALYEYEHDNLNRVTLKNKSGSSIEDVYYKYDLRGLTQHSRFASNSGQGIINTFNGFGELKDATNTMGGASRKISYQYDANGNRTRVTHPDNVYFSYQFDQMDRVTGVGESASTSNILTLTYAENGKRDNILRNGSSGAVTDYNYDAVQRMNEFAQNFSGTASDLTNSFAFNPVNQVVQLTRSNNIYHYTGNEDLVGSYQANGLNQYTTVNGVSYAYDGNGNLTSDANYAYTFDDENRLTGVSGAATASLAYDPLGRLYQVTINGAVRQFLYDGDALISEYTGSGTNSPVRRYVHGDQVDEPWVQYNSSAIGASYRRYLHNDHQGSIIAHSNYQATVLATLSYDAYGIPAAGNIDRFGYTGQIWFKELGLYHYKARMYSPKLGRFLQTDPIFYKDQMNLYSYVYNDPVNYQDSTGKVGFLASPAGRAVFGAPIGLVGGFLGNGIAQTVLIMSGTQEGFDLSSFAFAGLSGAVEGAVIGATFGRPRPGTVAIKEALTGAKAKALTSAITGALLAGWKALEDATTSGTDESSTTDTTTGNEQKADVEGIIYIHGDGTSDHYDGQGNRVNSDGTVTPSSSGNGGEPSRADRGMSGGNHIICSGTGAVKGGC